MVLDMDKTKTVAVAVVVVIVAVAAVAAVVYTNNNDEGNRYDTSKGWYSWDPIAMETKSAYFSITPLLITAAEGMYEEIYGSEIDYSKYSMSDVPDDFLSYDSLVVSSDADTVTVKSTIRESSDANGSRVIETVVAKNPDHLLTTSGYAAVLHELFGMRYGAEAADTMLWDYVYALDKSSWTTASMSDLYGLTIPEDVISVTSTYSLITNLESYVDYVTGATENGESFLMLASGALGNDASELGPFFEVLDSASGPASAVFFFSNDLGDVLSAFEVVGAIYGLEDEAQQYIDNFRLHMYAINQESQAKDLGYKVYLESNSGTAAGSGTITSDVFNMLCLENINKTDQWQTISDEVVIDEQPEVIIFYDTNTKSWDERMRVGVSLI